MGALRDGSGIGEGLCSVLSITLPPLDASREGRGVSRRGRAAACEH